MFHDTVSRAGGGEVEVLFRAVEMIGRTCPHQPASKRRGSGYNPAGAKVSGNIEAENIGLFI